MTQHTPEPWYTAWAISTEHGPVCNIRTGKQGMGPTVALVYGDEANAPDKPITYEQAQANAALIAAAPALLEALRKLSVDAAIFTRTMPESGGSRAYWAEMRRRLIISNTEVQAVIAAAEGE